MEPTQLVVIFVILTMIVVLYKDLFRPVIVFLSAIVIFAVSGILTPQQALSGFSNSQVVTIILLLIISNIIKRSAVLDGIFTKLFKSTYSYKGFLGRMMLYIGGVSAFMNNTPLVATFMPYVNDWGKRNNILPSKILIPLSYGAMAGGMATLIGTSTHLITSGFVIENGLKPLDIFDFSVVGIPMALVVMIYMLLIGNKLLPNRKDALDDFNTKSREYIAETIIQEGSVLAGKTVEDAELRNMKSLFLVEILRGGRTIAPVSPLEVLQEGDILFFAGATDTIVDLIQSKKGLSVYKYDFLEQDSKIDIVEAVVPANSQIINRNVKNSNFTGRYNASIIGVHRKGEKVSGKIGSVRLAAGDLLLLVTGKHFQDKTVNSDDFYVLSEAHEIRNLDLTKAVVSLGGLIIVILMAIFLNFPLFKGLLCLLGILLVFKIATIDEVKKSIDLELFGILGFALAFGTAFIETGAAEVIASSILSVTQPFGILGVMVGLFAMTSILAALMNSAAALSVTFPIAIVTASSLGFEDVTPFALLVSFAAAANFMTPFGYQTNLIIFEPGGYNFKDFTKVGVPLNICYLIGTILILCYMYNLL